MDCSVKGVLYRVEENYWLLKWSELETRPWETNDVSVFLLNGSPAYQGFRPDFCYFLSTHSGSHHSSWYERLSAATMEVPGRPYFFLFWVVAEKHLKKGGRLTLLRQSAMAATKKGDTWCSVCLRLLRLHNTCCCGWHRKYEEIGS